MTKLSLKIVMILLTTVWSSYSYAADLLVEQNGPTGTYPTITDAINAASSGDRILVQPTTGINAYYTENIIIDKDLEILSNVDGVKFQFIGIITVNLAANRRVVISSMDMDGGSSSISYAGAGSLGTSSVDISIIDSDILGEIDLEHTNINLLFTGCNLEGELNFSFGRVIGNETFSSEFYLSGNSNLVGDIQVIGNRCILSRWYINHSSNNDLTFKNNLVTQTGAIGSINNQLVYLTNNIIGDVFIDNCSFYQIYNNRACIYVSGGASIFITNNIFDSGTASNTVGVSNTSSSNNVACNYNYFGNNIAAFNSTAPASLGFYNQDVNNTLNTTTGEISNTLSPAINGANPSTEYYDIDLTRGDAGCYGGSFTHDNFFPLTTGTARVFMVDMPRIITQGASINVNAESYDE